MLMGLKKCSFSPRRSLNKMSDSGGTDNPAFSNEDECQENSRTESNQDQSSKSNEPIRNGNSFGSQHYEPASKNDAQYKTETRIEVPGDTEKSTNAVKTNGVHGNGNNNDASFLNTSVASVQANGKENLGRSSPKYPSPECSFIYNYREINLTNLVGAKGQLNSKCDFDISVSIFVFDIREKKHMVFE